MNNRLAVVWWLVMLLASCSKAEPQSGGSSTTAEGGDADETAGAGPSGGTPGTGGAGSRGGPFVLTGTVNHDGREVIVRGWPVVLRVSAVFDHRPSATESYALDDDALTIGVRGEDGTPRTWEFVAPSSQRAVLDRESRGVETLRVLSAEKSLGIENGTYELQLEWGPARDRLELTVEDAPEESAEVREERALIEADAALSLGRFDEAIDVLDAALDVVPRSVALANQRALAHEAAGDDEAALLDAQAALQEFWDQYPDATEPPMTILDVNNRLFSRLFGRAP